MTQKEILSKLDREFDVLEASGFYLAYIICSPEIYAMLLKVVKFEAISAESGRIRLKKGASIMTVLQVVGHEGINVYGSPKLD